MSALKRRELKMQEKRKNTPFRDFLKEIVSRRALPFYKIGDLVSRYPDTPRIKGIVGHKEFHEQRDDLLNHGLSYDASKSFFEQMETLFTSIPLENTLLLSGCENSEYADQCRDAKNTYLSYSIILSENILYSSLAHLSVNIVNGISVVQSENVYQSHSVVKSYNIFYSKHVDNCRDLRFCANMVGCQECLFCQNLDNTSYCIHNKQYPKEEYLEKKKQLLLQKENFLSFFINLSPGKTITVSKNVTGGYITDCSEVENGYYIQATHRSRNVVFISGGEGAELLHDTYAAAGLPGCRGYYGVMGCTGGDNVYNSFIVPSCTSVYYSYGMESCSFCLGCVGLVNKSFCIFNKQYSKEERYELANKIFEQMDKDGTLGTFFPGSMNPFYFNDTVAYLMDDSFTKEEVIKEGYLRRDEEIKVDVPEGAEVVEVKNLKNYQGFENGGWKINPEILEKVIKDEKQNYYRIMPMELQFLQKHGLPLPELHRLERIKLGFKFK